MSVFQVVGMYVWGRVCPRGGPAVGSLLPPPHFQRGVSPFSGWSKCIYLWLAIYLLMSSEKVRISSSLLRSVDQYLSSDLARSKGFRSRREVIEEAIRRFLDSEGFWSNQRFKHVNAGGNQVTIYDSLLRRVATVYVVYPDRTFCDLCSEPDCVHVVYALSIPKVAKALARRGFKLPERLISAE